MLLKEVTEYLADTRADLRGRLPNVDQFGNYPGPLSKIDVRRAKGALGLDTYIGWKDSVRDTVDSLLALEEIWGTRQTGQSRISMSVSN
jgi:hypothetical protein